MQAAVEQAKERGLARAIAPDQADFLAWGETDGRAIEHDLDAATQRYILDNDHGEFQAGLRGGSA
jgi:hypothetical protein